MNCLSNREADPIKSLLHPIRSETVLYRVQQWVDSCNTLANTNPEVNVTYIKETVRRLYQRIKKHSGKDSNSCIFRHSVDAEHAMVNSNNFKIIATGKKHTYTRKITEALYVKRDKPSLNVQTMSVPLKLF